MASDGGHPLLTRSRLPHPIFLSSREMVSLYAICDALVPSIQIPDSKDEYLKTFYGTSASKTATVQYVACMISGGLRHPLMPLLRLALWLLSTWFGTLLMCGWASVSLRFPYLQSFSQLPLHRREQILLSWSCSSFVLYQMLFKCLKFLTARSFYALIDEKRENMAWKAIGYRGPDPDFVDRKKKMETAGKVKEETEEDRFGPLHRCIVNMNDPKIVVLEALNKAGFETAAIPRPQGKNGSSSPSLTIVCDAVVVGSGSGGGLVAGVLAKAGYKVIVLEKGNYYARSNLSLLEGPSTAEMYEGLAMVASNNLSALLLAGSTVGGGSAVNWSASIKTPPHVTKEWCEEYGLELFGSKAFKEALDAVCDRMGVQSEISEEGFNNAVLRKGCLEMGYPVQNIPRNSSSDHYCGWCHLGCKDGRKKGTQETWLVDLVSSGNGLILPGCSALKVLHRMHKGRKVATGVVFERAGQGCESKEVHFIESRVTIVACGALGTPVLLKSSGLKNPNIGKHLHIHPTVMAWGYFPESSSSSGVSTDVWPENEKKSYEGGIMTAMSTVVANFQTSGYGAVIQTPSLHPAMFAVVTPWLSGLDMKERMTRFSRTAHVFALARDKGSGVANYPKSLSYKLDALDEENLQRGLEKMLRLLAAAGAEEIGTHHCSGERLNVKLASSQEFEMFVKHASSRRLRDLRTPICSAHQMGSCRMGVSPKESAVNERGETWEVEGLFVADTSVFPTALGVNPMVTVQAISYCTAQSILELLSIKNDQMKNRPDTELTRAQ
ncbi:long-chain-alcohol oxidase FAO4A-like [Aristolochia californica]|uniref:long-chain-alcohol oxidase FAO4A-like n=1 Tax=Aristolochia californica TaxID=171875 RepID=UPI0035DAA5A5